MRSKSLASSVTLIAAALVALLFAASPRVLTQAPMLVFGSNSGTAQPVNSTSNALWVSLQSTVFGTGTATFLPMGVINVNTTPVSNTGTGETDLITYALPGGSLSANGKGVEITAWGTLAANADNKTVRMYFGATVIAASITVTSSGSGWYAHGTVIRTGATTQVAGAVITMNNSGAYPNGTSPTETLSGNVTIKATGQSGTGSNDITQTGLVVKALP